MSPINYTCPYCNGELPAPSRKRSCPHCKKVVYARTRPNKEKVWLKEEDVAAFEKEWELHRQKQIFLREASETQNFVYNDFDKLETKAKQAFKSGNRDEAWRLHNQALIKAGEKYDDANWSARFRAVYLAMACQLGAEGRYKESLPFFAKMLYWACLEEALREVNYQRATNFNRQEKQQVVSFSLNVEQTLPPLILEPVITALKLAGTTFSDFETTFLKETPSEQQLATKLIHTHEEARFEAPLPDVFWKIIGKVIEDNFEIKVKTGT